MSKYAAIFACGLIFGAMFSVIAFSECEPYARQRLASTPKPPCEMIRNLPKGHLDVLRDGDGFYWTGADYRGEWVSGACSGCHGNRWNGGSGAGCTEKWVWNQYQGKPGDADFKYLGCIPENPDAKPSEERGPKYTVREENGQTTFSPVQTVKPAVYFQSYFEERKSQ